MDFFFLRNILQTGRNPDSPKYPASRQAPRSVTEAAFSEPASIHALPVEILQDVFIDYCTIDIQQYAENAKRYKREAQMFPPVHPDQLRCRLSLVCRRWASILRRTPRVWTQLVFLDYIPYKATIHQWLHRSDPLPLELLILLWRPQQSGIAEDFLRLLSPHVSKFRFFMAEFSRDNQFRDLLIKYLFPVGQVIHIPELTVLHLHQFFPPSTLPIMGSINTPKLFKLFLMSGYQSGGAYLVPKALEYVHLLLTKDIAQDFKFLFKVKQTLRTLNLEINDLPDTVLDIPFRLPCLTTLKLAIRLPSHVFFWDSITAIFEKLELPVLEVLDVSVMGHLSRRDASPSLRSLVFGKSPRIQEFICAGLSLGPDLYNIFAYLRELKRISLLSCIIEETFFQRFIEPPSSSSPVTNFNESSLCPALEEIQFSPCVEFSIGHLERLLRLREDIVVLVTLQDVKMDINDSSALVSLEETYSQFALRANAISLWTTNEHFLPFKYLNKAFSMIGLLSRSYAK